MRAEDEMNDSLDDLLGGKIVGPAKALPESYKPLDYTEPCKKCGGSGSWLGRGACFACKGKGKLTYKTSPAERSQKRAHTAEKKVRDATAAIEAFKTEHPDVWAWMDGSTYPFAVSLREGLEKYGSLTDGQLAAAERCIVITAGKLIRSRECTPGQEAKLIEVAADPQRAAVAYGRLTGSCACCGRTLSNAESLARGIGPICAETFGW